jgi:hypothetical protein
MGRRSLCQTRVGSSPGEMSKLPFRSIPYQPLKSLACPCNMIRLGACEAALLRLTRRLKLRVFRFCLPQNWDIRVCILPER